MTDELALVSVGYEGRTVDDLLTLLQTHNVSVLVDVRLTPISRKKGFSKKALSEVLADAGIEYRHERELGNPKDNREPFRQGLTSARDLYIHHLRNGASSIYTKVVRLTRSNRIALLCYERDTRACHRSCILDLAREEHPDLRILEL